MEEVNHLAIVPYINLNNIVNNIVNSNIEHIDCSICLEKIVNDDKYITSCNHTFHEECIARWMLLNHNCPLCRKHFDYEVDGYNDESDGDGNGNDDVNDNPIINNSNTNNNISYNNTSLPDSLHVYAVNYNMLRIMSGMGGLSYSS